MVVYWSEFLTTDYEVPGSISDSAMWNYVIYIYIVLHYIT
jgi:hypothetical protein